MKEFQNFQVETQPTLTELRLQCWQDMVLKSLVMHPGSPGVLVAQCLEHLIVKPSVLAGHCTNEPSLSNLAHQACVSQKTRKLYRPEKPLVKLRPAY